jgi:hypothetical protein
MDSQTWNHGLLGYFKSVRPNFHGVWNPKKIFFQKITEFKLREKKKFIFIKDKKRQFYRRSIKANI